MLRWLEAAFAAYLVDDDQAPPNYSVQLNAPEREGQRPFHFLFQAGTTAARSGSARRIVHALLLHLSGLVEEARGDGLTAGALPLVRDGRCLLVPPGARADLKRTERAFNRAGIAVDDHHHALIDLVTGELVVEAPTVGLAEEAYAALARLSPEPARAEDVAPEGRYPVVGWAFLDQSRPELTGADGVLRALNLLRHAHVVGVQGSVDALARLFVQAKPVTIESWSAHDVIEAFDRCVGDVPV